MIRVGKVIEKQGDSLSVCFSRSEGCGSCSMCGSARDSAAVLVKGDAQTGDYVEVDMPEARVLKASFISYMLPLAGLLLGLWLGTQLFKNRELAVMLPGFAVMGVIFAGLKLIDKRVAASPEWQPKLIRVIEEDAAPDPQKEKPST